MLAVLACHAVGARVNRGENFRLILLGSQLLDLIVIVFLFLLVVAQEDLNIYSKGKKYILDKRLIKVFKILTVSLSCGTNIVIFDKLLLFTDHVLEIDDRPCLQLQVQKELHILALQEIILHDKLEEVLVVLELDSV